MDFEAMIRAALKDGNSMEDIASAVGATMNKIQDEEKKKGTNAAKALAKEWKEVFDRCYTTGKLDIDDVATIATVVCRADHPEWTPDNMNEFRGAVRNSISTLSDISGKDFNKAFESLMRNVFGPINREENRGNGVKLTLDIAEKRIKDFLDSL